MPYIKSNDGRRNSLQIGDVPKIAGELNYQIFYFIKHRCKELTKKQILNAVTLFVSNFLVDDINYQKYNDMAGCLILCAKELKRRLKIDLTKEFEKIIDSYDDEIAKYEDKKILENGDVE